MARLRCNVCSYFCADPYYDPYQSGNSHPISPHLLSNVTDKTNGKENGYVSEPFHTYGDMTGIAGTRNINPGLPPTQV